MLVYIDDREDEELDGNYGYDYGCDEEGYDYEYDSEKESYEYIQIDDSYFDIYK